MMPSIQQIALAHLHKQDLAILHIKSMGRQDRTAALGIDFYRADDRLKPLNRMRFCVARFEWCGSHWRRVYKYGGPKPLNQIHEDLTRRAKSLGIPTIDQA